MTRYRTDRSAAWGSAAWRSAVPALALLAGAGLRPSGAALAQETEPARSWQELTRELEPGRSLRVELREDGFRLGRAVSADDSVLVLRVLSAGRPTTFQRSAIRSVAVKTSSKWVSGALVGGGIAVAGTLAYALLSSEGISIDSHNDLLVVAVPFLGGLGFGLGAAVGSQIYRYRVYRPGSPP